MSDYRRYFVPGGTYFFTVVTERRSRLFADEAARRLLGEAMRECRLRYPFEIAAIVLLPEHLHALWMTPIRCGGEGSSGSSLGRGCNAAGLRRSVRPRGSANGDAAFGNADFGNIRSATKATSKRTSITSTTIP